jgi:hypothetical protein
MGEHQLDVVLGAPRGDLRFLVRAVVVADQVEPSGREAAAQLLAEVEELPSTFAVAEPVEHLPVARSSAANICRTPAVRV